MKNRMRLKPKDGGGSGRGYRHIWNAHLSCMSLACCFSPDDEVNCFRNRLHLCTTIGFSTIFGITFTATSGGGENVASAMSLNSILELTNIGSLWSKVSTIRIDSFLWALLSRGVYIHGQSGWTNQRFGWSGYGGSSQLLKFNTN